MNKASKFIMGTEKKKKKQADMFEFLPQLL